MYMYDTNFTYSILYISINVQYEFNTCITALLCCGITRYILHRPYHYSLKPVDGKYGDCIGQFVPCNTLMAFLCVIWFAYMISYWNTNDAFTHIIQAYFTSTGAFGAIV